MKTELSVAVFMQATCESTQVAVSYLERSDWNVWNALAAWRTERLAVLIAVKKG